MIENETFTSDLIDWSFDWNDTIVLITPEGNIFKIGNPVDNGDGTLSFDVAQLG